MRAREVAARARQSVQSVCARREGGARGWGWLGWGARLCARVGKAGGMRDALGITRKSRARRDLDKVGVERVLVVVVFVYVDGAPDPRGFQWLEPSEDYGLSHGAPAVDELQAELDWGESGIAEGLERVRVHGVEFFADFLGRIVVLEDQVCSDQKRTVCEGPSAPLDEVHNFLGWIEFHLIFQHLDKMND